MFEGNLHDCIACKLDFNVEFKWVIRTDNSVIKIYIEFNLFKDMNGFTTKAQENKIIFT